MPNASMALLQASKVREGSTFSMLYCVTRDMPAASAATVALTPKALREIHLMDLFCHDGLSGRSREQTAATRKHPPRNIKGASRLPEHQNNWDLIHSHCGPKTLNLVHVKPCGIARSPAVRQIDPPPTGG